MIGLDASVGESEDSSDRAMEVDIPSRSNAFNVDLDALDHNVREIRRVVGSDVSFFAALKANAYGFGILEIARAVLDSGVDGLAVVDLRDAVALRDAGITVPIHLYGGMLITPEVARIISRHDFMPTILRLDDAKTISEHAASPVRVFVKVEVGLERFGIDPSEIVDFVDAISDFPNIVLHGLCTHLHVPKREASEVVPYLAYQFARFEAAIRRVEERGIQVPLKMAASSGSMFLSKKINLNAVDPGHLLFGLHPGGPEIERLDIRPVLKSLRTKLAHVHIVRRTEFLDLAPFQIRENMRIGVAPIGVVDGMLSIHCGAVLIDGTRCKVLDVSLEHTRIDITDVGADVGDEVVIVGRQGRSEIAIDEVLTFQKMRIPASVPLAVHHTVPRLYVRRGV